MTVRNWPKDKINWPKDKINWSKDKINCPKDKIKFPEAAPFSVRSTPDFRNSNGIEQNTVT